MWTAFLDSWGATLGYPLTLLLMVWLGRQYAHHHYRSQQHSWLATGMESGIIGMFGLLVSFTLAASGDTVRARDAAIHHEVTAMMVAHRQGAFYPPALRRYLDDYLRTVLNTQLRHPTPTPAQCQLQMHQLAQVSRQLDAQLVAYAARHPAERAGVQTLVGASTDLNATLRVLLYSFQERTPPPVVLALIALSWISGFLVGFMNNFQTHPSWMLLLVFVGTILVLMAAIRDLDDPSRGTVTPDYQDLRRTHELLFGAR